MPTTTPTQATGRARNPPAAEGRVSAGRIPNDLPSRSVRDLVRALAELSDAVRSAGHLPPTTATSTSGSAEVTDLLAQELAVVRELRARRTRWRTVTRVGHPTRPPTPRAEAASTTTCR